MGLLKMRLELRQDDVQATGRYGKKYEACKLMPKCVSCHREHEGPDEFLCTKCKQHIEGEDDATS